MGNFATFPVRLSKTKQDRVILKLFIASRYWSCTTSLSLTVLAWQSPILITFKEIGDVCNDNLFCRSLLIKYDIVWLHSARQFIEGDQLSRLHLQCFFRFWYFFYSCPYSCHNSLALVTVMFWFDISPLTSLWSIRVVCVFSSKEQSACLISYNVKKMICSIKSWLLSNFKSYKYYMECKQRKFVNIWQGPGTKPGPHRSHSQGN